MKDRYYEFDLTRLCHLVCSDQILLATHCSSYTLMDLDFTSCILLSAKYILTMTELHHLISCGSRLYRLHLCREVRLPPPKQLSWT